MVKKFRVGYLLDWVERSVNRLPDPFFLFLILSAMVLLTSLIFGYLHLSVIHPATGMKIEAVNLLTRQGFQRIMTEAVRNFVEFPPFGLVIVSLIGIGVADKSGFFEAALKHLISRVPKGAITFVIIFAGVNANIIGDAGLIIMPSLGAIVFAGIGRHPIAGLTAGFAGVCGGFSANLFITSLDPLLSGFTDFAARIIDPAYNVYPTANYYFMVASVFVVSIAGTIANRYFVEPRLGKWDERMLAGANKLDSIIPSKKEKKALYAGYALMALVLLAVAMAVIPSTGLLRDEKGGLMPLYKSLIPIILVLFFISGAAYGYISGKIRNNKDLTKMCVESMSSMGPYILLAFAAGQFVAYFNWSNIGIIAAVKGADFLKSIGLVGIPLIIVFLLFTTIFNIFIYSASAKWAVFSVVFVPMFMMLGYSPELTMAVYRVGDSVTNMISPLLPYFPIVIVFAKKYVPDITIGKLISLLVPYSIVFFITWGIFLILWIIAGIPIGPDAPVHYFPKSL